jgi:hypothetical protein
MIDPQNRGLDFDRLEKWVGLDPAQLADFFNAIAASAPMVAFAAERTSRAEAARVMRDLYGSRGPRGVKNEDLLTFVNERLQGENRSAISLSTVLRARKSQYPWWPRLSRSDKE